MKKLFFGMACIIGMMFFASCTQEAIDEIMAQKPVVEFVEGEGLTAANASVYVGTVLNFKVKVAPNSGSKSELVNFNFSITDLTGASMMDENPTIGDPNGDNYFEFTLTPDHASAYAVTATATDKAGKINIVKIVVDCVQPTVEGIGTFVGTMTLTGHITSDTVQGYSYNQDEQYENIPMTIVLGSLEEDNRVMATFEIEGTPVSLYATKTENTLAFDPFEFTKSVTLVPFTVALNFTMNMEGNLVDDVLTLSGNCTGAGTGSLSVFVTIHVNFNDGVISGELTKSAE